MELFDFYADWCGMCKQLMPIIDEFHTKHPELTIKKINSDENEDLVEKYEIRHLPTLIFMKDDKIVYRCSRLLTIEELEEIYKTHM